MTNTRPRPTFCTVCRSNFRDEIEMKSISGASVRHVAEIFGLSKSAISRHMQKCVSAQLVEAMDEADAAHYRSLLTVLQDLLAQAQNFVSTADPKIAVQAIGAARQVVMDIAKLTNQVPSQRVEHTGAAGGPIDVEYRAQFQRMVDSLMGKPLAEVDEPADE